MIIFQYLLQIGIVQLLYSFIIYWIILLLAMLMALLKVKTWGMYAIKLINYYLYISVIGLITLSAIEISKSFFYGILIILIGLFFTFLTIGQGMYQGRKEAIESSAYAALEGMKYDTYFLIGSLIFFITVLFFPVVSETFPVQVLLFVIDWIYKLPIIGFLLSLLGVYSMLGTIFQFIVISIVGIVYLNEKVANSNRL